MYYPSIIEVTGRGSKSFDLPTKLLQERIIYIGSEINSDVANFVIMQLMWLNSVDPDSPIDMYINSPGGSVYDGMAIKDIINHISPKVNTLGIGMCASMGAYLLSAGTGTRKVTKNCRIMIHSVSSGAVGTVQDIEVNYEEAKYLQEIMLKDMVQFSGGKTTLSTLRKKTSRDYYMGPDEAIKLGLIDTIV